MAFDLFTNQIVEHAVIIAFIDPAKQSKPLWLFMLSSAYQVEFDIGGL